MVVVNSVGLLAPSEVKGAFVKVQPTVRSSERWSIDRKAVKERLLAAGARAVVVTPVVVPDSTEDVRDPARPPVALSPEMHLAEWFGSVKAEETLKSRAFDEAVNTLGAAGLM